MSRFCIKISHYRAFIHSSVRNSCTACKINCCSKWLSQYAITKSVWTLTTINRYILIVLNERNFAESFTCNVDRAQIIIFDNLFLLLWRWSIICYSYGLLVDFLTFYMTTQFCCRLLFVWQQLILLFFFAIRFIRLPKMAFPKCLDVCVGGVKFNAKKKIGRVNEWGYVVNIENRCVQADSLFSVWDSRCRAETWWTQWCSIPCVWNVLVFLGDLTQFLLLRIHMLHIWIHSFIHLLCCADETHAWIDSFTLRYIWKHSTHTHTHAQQTKQ